MKIQSVKVPEGLTYAEAMKRVKVVEPKDSTQKVTTRTKESHSCSKVNDNTMLVDKV